MTTCCILLLQVALSVRGDVWISCRVDFKESMVLVRNKLPLGAVAVGSALCLCLSSTVQADEAALQRQIEAQQRTMLSQQNQIVQMQNDMAIMRGEMEQLRYLLSRQTGTQIPDYSSATATVAANPNLPAGTNNVAAAESTTANNSMPVTPMGNSNLAARDAAKAAAANAPATTNNASTTTQTLDGVDATAQAAYNAAYAKVQQNDLAGAQTAFKQYVETYPNNTLTPNAWYWLGQVQYSQAIYDQARLSFLNVARYNNSQKRPDALYKLGMINKFIGDTDKASRYFQLVIQTYPNNAAATLASRELQRLQG